MEAHGNSVTARISRYLELHTLMQGADKIITGANGTIWPEYNLSQTRLSAPPGVETLQLLANNEFRDALGNPRNVVLGHKPGDESTYYAWISPIGSHDLAPQCEVMKRRPDGLLELRHEGQSISNDRFLYNHQVKAIKDYADAVARNADEDAGRTSREVVPFATGTGKSYIVAHTLKAIGAHGAVIVPQGLGAQITKEFCEVMPEGVDIREGLAIAGNDASDVKRQLKNFNGIVVIEAQDLPRFMGSNARPGWLCDGARKHVSIDEAHEFTMRLDPDTPSPGMHLLERLAQHNDIMAVTATPNDDLYRALGIAGRAPAGGMTMFDAMHRLPDRAFRPLALEKGQAGTPAAVHTLDAAERERLNAANEPAMRFAALVGYFGRDEYKGPDYYLDATNDTWDKRTDSDARFATAAHISGSLQHLRSLVGTTEAAGASSNADRGLAVVHAMRQNQVRFAQHKHIAFAVRPELVRNLAIDLQGIHDGDYQQLPALKDAVWNARAQSAIAEYIREYRREYKGIPLTLQKFLDGKGLGILGIRGENLAASSANQEAYRTALRSIKPNEFEAVLPSQLFSELIGTPQTINLQAEAQNAAQHTARQGALCELAQRTLQISAKHARTLAQSGTLGQKLHAEKVDTDAALEVTPTHYALAIVKEQGHDVVYDGHGERTELTAKDVERLVKTGQVMHVTDTHSFVTGFSDPDVMMTTRVVENLGDYNVRATQILGRPIREKDGVAALNELVGPCVNLKGTLGVDRHFSCHEVVSDDFFELSREYENNYIREGRALWAPPTVQQGIMASEQLGRGRYGRED